MTESHDEPLKERFSIRIMPVIWIPLKSGRHYNGQVGKWQVLKLIVFKVSVGVVVPKALHGKGYYKLLKPIIFN